MKIRFNKTLDDFAAFQMFHHENREKKTTISSKIFWVLLLIIGLCIIGQNIYYKNYKVVSFLAIIVVVYFILRSRIFLSTSFYKQAEYYQKEGMGELVGENEFSFDKEYLYCESDGSQVKKALSGIEKIVCCPDHVFIYTNPVTAHCIFRKSIIEGDFDAFVNGLIETYQMYAAAYGSEAKIIQGDWIFKREDLQKGLTFQEKAANTCDIVIWAFIFGMGAMIVSLLIFGLIMHLAYQNGWVEQAEDVPEYVVYIVFGIPLLCGLLGGFLSFRGKLPKIKVPYFNAS